MPFLACLTWSVSGLLGPDYQLLPPRSRASALFCGQIAVLTLASCLAPVTGLWTNLTIHHHYKKSTSKHGRSCGWTGCSISGCKKARCYWFVKLPLLKWWCLVPHPQCPSVAPHSLWSMGKQWQPAWLPVSSVARPVALWSPLLSFLQQSCCACFVLLSLRGQISVSKYRFI